MNQLFSNNHRRIILSAFKPVVGLFSAILLLAFPSAGKVMDNGVDPENLGTGDWIYYMSQATNHLGGNVPMVNDVESLMAYFKSAGVDWIAVKAGTGAAEFPSADNPQFTKELVDAAHAMGLKIFGYTRSDGKDVPGEIKLVAKVYEQGADGFIIDAESEWEPHILGEDPHPLALQLGEGIKKAFPNKFLGHAPLPVISLHSQFPYKEFGLYCDAVMPQDYWKSLKHTPEKMVERMDTEWRKWQNSLHGSDTNAIKPIAPIGHGWNLSKDRIVTEREILEFVMALNEDKNPVTPGGYKGVSYWRADLHTPAMWRGIKRARIGHSFTIPAELAEDKAEAPSANAPIANTAAAEKPVENTAEAVAETKPKPAAPADPNDIILDDENPGISFEGNWYPGRMPAGRYGETYMCSNAASPKRGPSIATYRPKIEKGGPYDIFIWYSSHLNRSTNSLWIVSGANGTITNRVNQRRSGGDWYQLASDVPFIPGTNGFVRVSNATGETPNHVIVADAVRFVLKEKGKTEGQ